jgi:hypothetical protein
LRNVKNQSRSLNPTPRRELILEPGYPEILEGAVRMPVTHINFDAPASLRKWPSIKNERASNAVATYLVVEGTLDDCIRKFTEKAISQQHLYEIHTAPQGELVGAVLSAKLILEIARLRDFL